tara:strand:- start:690 stop:1001 length:312 start_codon:yes stop_codon:yes gene_type:complete
MDNRIIIYPSEYDAVNNEAIEGATIEIMRPTAQGLESSRDIVDFAEKYVPELRPFIIASPEDLPEDETFAKAWTADFSEPTGVGLGQDMYALRELKKTEVEDE